MDVLSSSAHGFHIQEVLDRCRPCCRPRCAPPRPAHQRRQGALRGQAAEEGALEAELDAAPLRRPRQHHELLRDRRRREIDGGKRINLAPASLRKELCAKRPKGVHIITGIRDDQPNSLQWIVDTTDNKPFELRATSIKEKQHFLECMKKAALVHQRRSSLDSRSANMGTVRTPTSIDEKLHAALELGANGFIGPSVAALAELDEASPDNAELLFHLGSCRLVEGQELQAIAVLSDAAVLAETTDVPLYCDIMNNMGLAHFFLGNFGPAKVCLKNALTHRPKDEELLSNMALICLDSGDVATAEALLRVPMKASAPRRDTMLNWAEIMVASDKVPAAIECLQRLVAVHSDCHFAYYKLGELYELQESTYVLAVGAYEMAFSLQDHRVNYAAALTRVRLEAAERLRSMDTVYHHSDLPSSSDSSPNGGIQRKVEFVS